MAIANARCPAVAHATAAGSPHRVVRLAEAHPLDTTPAGGGEPFAQLLEVFREGGPVRSGCWILRLNETGKGITPMIAPARIQDDAALSRGVERVADRDANGIALVFFPALEQGIADRDLPRFVS